MQTPIMLVILDGFGHSNKKKHNAVYLANTPHLDYWQTLYPYTYIHASGTYVGLPQGSIGNSEVGHLTIGAGRIIEQPLTRMNALIESDQLCKNTMLHNNLMKLQKSRHALHILGLISDAGVHAHINHMIAFLKCASLYDIQSIFIHAFLDGRDTPPQSAFIYLEMLSTAAKQYHATIASIHGRFFAMDRDNNWERTLATYRVLTTPCTNKTASWNDIVKQYYNDGITDEFILPTQLDPHGYIQNGDGIIFINVRPDRARQLTACFLNPTDINKKFPHVQPAFFITPVRYADTLKSDVLLEEVIIDNTLKEVLSHAGKSMYAIAETEKYAHITYFFNGQKENLLPHEERCLIQSERLVTYKQFPEMKAPEITNALLKTMDHNPKDFYLVNFANADMVGHSGDCAATIKAIEILDHQLNRLYEHFVLNMQGMMIITADHGKAEDMYDEQTQQPNTAHTNNMVLFMCIKKDVTTIPDITDITQLADIAPFILKCMDVEVPQEMKKQQSL